MRVFSEDWAQAFYHAINANDAYRAASQQWEAGPLALILRHADGEESAILVDLWRGACRSAQRVLPSEAMTQATFVIYGEEAAWQEVLGGHIQPLMAIMRGKLKLQKGSLAKLMPYTKAAIELVSSAQTVPTEF